MLRVLYLENTAGALTAVADWLHENGHMAKIIIRRHLDMYGLTLRSPTAIAVNGSPQFFQEIRKQIKKMKPTHIHVNTSITALAVARSVAPYTPIVFHYHGSEVRGRKFVHPEVQLLADKIIVSTADLRKYGEWYPCPISKEFYYRGGRKKGTAVIIISKAVPKDPIEKVKEICQAKNLQLTIIDCRKGDWISSDDMPSFLSQFEYYLDVRGLPYQGTISKTAMEAMSVGCKILHETDLSRPLKYYKKATPIDYVNLYRSMKKPSILLTPLRLAYSLPRSIFL
ncbi:MAG: glycosyltransferase [Candidatus Thorarchaeota archaeon]